MGVRFYTCIRTRKVDEVSAHVKSTSRLIGPNCPENIIYPEYVIPEVILNWPASRMLAEICDPSSATNICILIKRDSFLARLIMHIIL